MNTLFFYTISISIYIRIEMTKLTEAMLQTRARHVNDFREVCLLFEMGSK